ncbi:SHOCT domain-containing protein [Nonomuraea sp. NPDC050643]|uniref:SHOCT domain-containing protein n=1 Tax=Nonomuraea sp. NPDC050643 TaxID=3155660 RepID=UPI0033F8DB9C
MNLIAQWAPHFGPGGFSPIFPAFWGLFWIAVVALVITARRKGWWGPRQAPAAASPTAPAAPPASPTASPTASAEQILAERYARGELSDDEYFEKMSVLRGAS